MTELSPTATAAVRSAQRDVVRPADDHALGVFDGHAGEGPFEAGVPGGGRRPARRRDLQGAQPEVIRAVLMLGERTVPQSEVIRAIVSGYSPCCGRSRAP